MSFDLLYCSTDLQFDFSEGYEGFVVDVLHRQVFNSMMEENINNYKAEIKKFIEKATESLHPVRYNEKMIQFLCQQMNQVEKLMPCVPVQDSPEVLKILTDGVRKASTLVTSPCKTI